MKMKWIFEYWEKTKPIIVCISAILPLIVIIGSFFFCYDKDFLLKFSLAAIIYQIGILIVLARETQKSISKSEPKVITKIILNDEFWNYGKKFKRFDINALNGGSFIEMIDVNQISIDNIRLIIPSLDAMETYYKNNPFISNSETAIKTLSDSISNIQNNIIPEWKNTSKIKSFEIRRLSTFPLDFYAILDGKFCLVGKYQKDYTRKHTVGIKAFSWIEKDIQLISHHYLLFEGLWDSLGENR
jgi:hypothetical protein